MRDLHTSRITELWLGRHAVFARTRPPHQENPQLTWSQTDDSAATFRLKSLDSRDQRQRVARSANLCVIVEVEVNVNGPRTILRRRSLDYLHHPLFPPTRSRNSSSGLGKAGFVPLVAGQRFSCPTNDRSSSGFFLTSPHSGLKFIGANNYANADKNGKARNLQLEKKMQLTFLE